MSVPSWVRDAIVYLIFPDRFARSQAAAPGLEPWDAPPTRHGYKGGDLLGIVEHLDHLEDLSVNTLCLTPVFRATANHRYHTHDFFEIDPLLGGRAAFDTLLERCHARGIRLVLDGVFDHVGRGFHPFVDVVENGSDSPYASWFRIHDFPLRPYESNPGYDGWAGLGALPRLNTDEPAVREYLMTVAEHWARAGIDGWRWDTPAEIRTPGFWEELRSRVKAINPELYLVGEVWTDASEWLRGDRFDGTTNYWFGGHALAFVGGLDLSLCEDIDYPVKHPVDAVAFAEFAEGLIARYSDNHLAASLVLDASHDTPRILSLMQGRADRVILVKLLEYTFFGAPTLYYGEEVGLLGEGDPDCRAGFPWQGPWHTQIHDALRSLGALRRRSPALRHGEYRRLFAQGAGYAFSRKLEGERLGVFVNVGDEAVAMPIEGQATLEWGKADIRPGEVVLPARGGAVIRLD